MKEHQEPGVVADAIRERDELRLRLQAADIQNTALTQQISELQVKLDKEVEDSHYFECDLASALGWGREPETGMKEGEPFFAAIRRLRAELAEAKAECERLNARLLEIHRAVGEASPSSPSPIDAQTGTCVRLPGESPVLFVGGPRNE